MLSEELYRRILLFVICLISLTTVISIVYQVKSGLHYTDFTFRWKECYYLFNGINPLGSVNGEIILPEVGQIDDVSGAMPWTYILGIIINPPFLPYEFAKVYILVFITALAMITSVVVYKKMIKLGLDKNWAIIAALVVFTNASWVSTIAAGNNAFLVVCFLVIMVCIIDDHPYISGVLLAFAMMKPQIAAVFYISLLLKRKWKTIISSLAVIFIAWMIAAFLAKTSPIEMLFGIYQQGVSYDLSVNYGFFNLLKYIGVSNQTVLLLSAFFGCAILVIVSIYIIKTPELCKNEFLYYSVAAVVSTFWFYKFAHDYLINIIFALCWVIYMFSAKKNLSTLILGCGSIILMSYNVSYRFLSRILAVVLSIERDIATQFCTVLDNIILIFSLFLLIYLIKKQHRSSENKIIL